MRTQTCTHTHAHTGTHAHAGTRTHTQAHARTHTLRGADNGGVADTKLQDLSWSEARGGRDDLICSLSTCAGGRLGPGSSAQSHRRGPSPQELRVWRAQAGATRKPVVRASPPLQALAQPSPGRIWPFSQRKPKSSTDETELDDGTSTPHP
ncbi:uncharacterized protein LOC119509092 isoform X2 [Choloepus didactylus]|uniref:uncharacterized protein LOC119509092 isoform X2 n=1 Tax=Choloepus didactylus TaxID=27675 RepID=UPI00189E97F5|nr:uncharacterized protein LOC119509092 isoform X2 [Choloepus didactylus]